MARLVLYIGGPVHGWAEVSAFERTMDGLMNDFLFMVCSFVHVRAWMHARMRTRVCACVRACMCQ